MNVGWMMWRVRDHLRLRGVAYAVALISLCFSLLAFFYARQSLDTRNGVEFQEAVLLSERSIDRRTDAYTDALYGARAYFDASGNVSDDEWQRYISDLDIRDRYSGFQALGYLQHIPNREELQSYDGPYSGMVDLTDAPAPENGGYSLVRFVGPQDTANTRILGRDYNLEPAHFRAMERARDTGMATATSRVFVLAESDGTGDLELQPGFFVYLPVYRAGTDPRTAGDRRESLEGFVFGSFRMDQLLADLIGERVNPELDFEVYDGDSISPASLLYDRDGVLRAMDNGYAPDYSDYGSLEVSGRQWTLYFATLPGFVAASGSALPAFILIGGAGASFALFAATWLLAASRERAESIGAGLEQANRNLATANNELEAFSYSVSHDLRAPLRSIEGFSQVLMEDYSDTLDEEGLGYLNRVRAASRRMSELIDDLLQLSRVTRSPLERTDIGLDGIAREVAMVLEREEPSRRVEWDIRRVPVVSADPRLVRIVLENLIGNAWKFTSKHETSKIEFGAVDESRSGGIPTFYVRDDGAGFEMEYVKRLFGAFQRLHTEDEFQGTGIGLATVARIVHRHGGEARAEGEVGKGATIYFTLQPPKNPPGSAQR